MSELPHYSMVIAWSEEDRAYLVTLPEWTARAHMPIMHGATYQEAALESLVEQTQVAGKPLPRHAVAQQGVA